MDATVTSIFGLFKATVPILPLFALQAAAIVGMVGASLVATRRRGLAVTHRAFYLGLALGLVYYLIAWFTSEFMKGPVRLNLGIDILLLGGMLGGWRGGLVCFALAMGGRYEFSGTALFLTGMVDSGVDILAGIFLRKFLYVRALQSFSFSNVFAAWVVRIVATYGGLALALLTTDTSNLPVEQFILLRLVALPLSFFLLAIAMLLIYLDAQTDVQREREYQLTRMDVATGLPNRKALSEHLLKFCSPDASSAGCLLVVEVSNLRDFQLRCGPEEASQLWEQAEISNVAGAVMQPLAHYDPRVFQYGDFSIVIAVKNVNLDQLEHSKEIEDLMDRICGSIAIKWPDFRPVFRCAVVDLRSSGTDLPKGLPYHNITLALKSIEAGVAYFNDLIQRDSAIDGYIEASLNEWVRSGDAPIFYQPKVRLLDRTVSGAEGLLRMSDAEGRPISPMRVISLLRRQRRLVDFEWATIRSGVRFLARLQKIRPEITVAINVSAESLRNAGFGQRVCDLLESEGVPGKALRLEIVEWSELAEMCSVEQNLETLIQGEVSLSLDDFGVGYSTLLLLTQIAFSEVKIEQSLIATLENARSQSVVAFIVNVAHRCGATVVAEGTETLLDEQRVRALGVDVAQGYLYARALPPDEFIKYTVVS